MLDPVKKDNPLGTGSTSNDEIQGCPWHRHGWRRLWQEALALVAVRLGGF